MNESISELQHRLMLEASGRFEDRVDLMRLYEQRGGASLWKAAIEARQLGYADVAKGCALEGLELAFVKRGHALEQLYGSDGVARCAQEDIPFFGGLNRDVTMLLEDSLHC